MENTLKDKVCFKSHYRLVNDYIETVSDYVKERFTIDDRFDFSRSDFHRLISNDPADVIEEFAIFLADKTVNYNPLFQYIMKSYINEELDEYWEYFSDKYIEKNGTLLAHGGSPDQDN